MAPEAHAHDDHVIGALRLTVGWRDEPAYSGIPNAVEVIVVTAADGGPVTDPDAALRVEIAFGDERTALALLPAGSAGTFEATLLPTQPGTYSFRVTGTIVGERIEFGSACAEDTFDCVTDVGAVQFPAGDPSADQVAERLDRELRRSQEAKDDASRAKTLAMVALAVAVVSAAYALGGRRRRGA